MTDSNIQEKGERLVKDLNFFTAAGGDPEHPVPGVTSLGEATTAVARLKKELNESGIAYEWVDGSYVLRGKRGGKTGK
jgi:hypothetical protein